MYPVPNAFLFSMSSYSQSILLLVHPCSWGTPVPNVLLFWCTPIPGELLFLMHPSYETFLALAAIFEGEDRQGEGPLLYQVQAWCVLFEKQRQNPRKLYSLSSVSSQQKAAGFGRQPLLPLSAKPRLLSRALHLIQISIFRCCGLSTPLLHL